MARETVGGGGEGATKGNLISVFRRVLSPQKVNDIRITHDDGRVVLGYITTSCPVEKLIHLEDFEVHLGGRNGRMLDFVVVGGRRVRPPGSARRRTGKAPMDQGEAGLPGQEPATSS